MLGALRVRSRARRAPRAFGLDIGSTAVKVVELRDLDPSPAVARCASTPIAAGIVAEGAIRDAEAAAAAIRRAVATAGITGTDAAVGICGRELIIKKLQIPEIPARELKDAVRIEAEHEIPFAIDEVFLDYQITAEQNRLIDLTLVAAKKSKVMEYHAVVTAAGFTPVVVDVDGFALGNQHELTANATTERVALVDVGATMTKVAVVGGALTHLVRDVPFGGSRYTQAIAARLGVSLESAEAIKTGAARNPDPRDGGAGLRGRLARPRPGDPARARLPRGERRDGAARDARRAGGRRRHARRARRVSRVHPRSSRRRGPPLRRADRRSRVRRDRRQRRPAAWPSLSA